MLTPLIGLVLGIIILFSSFLIYQGKLKLLPNTLIVICQDNKFILSGLGIISIGLMLGIVGYTFSLANNNFRLLRIAILLLGLILIKLSLAKNLDKFPHVPKFLAYLINFNNVQFLQIFSGIIIALLFLKSIVAVDWSSGDTWMYQLPTAARFWGMITPQEYLFEAERETFYNTSTMLPNILQGFFWYLFGLQRPQGANLVSFLSLIGYFVFVKAYLKIPFYLSILTILAVPLIHIAATGCYVDLFGNIGLSITLIITCLLYIKDDFPKTKHIFMLVLGGFIAANSKYLLVPPLTIILFFVFLRILWLIILKNRPQKRQNLIKNLSLLIGIGSLSSLVIFATEFKNIILYQNPFYPLKVRILGYELNHAIVPSSDYMSDKLQAMFPVQRWIYSLLEIGAFNDNRPWPWTIAMDYVPLHDDTFGLGGYFSVYVVFHLVLFGFLCRHWGRETKVALSLVIIMSIITPFLPFAYQLRYYMYWMITLITLNLYLFLNQRKLSPKSSLMKPQYLGYAGLIVMVIFCILTRWDFTYPNRVTFNNFMSDRVEEKVLASIQEGEEVCLVGFSPLSFLYIAKFQPHLNRNYSIKSEFTIGTEYVKEKCGDRRIIYKE
jgi:hypothetical protein